VVPCLMGPFFSTFLSPPSPDFPFCFRPKTHPVLSAARPRPAFSFFPHIILTSFSIDLLTFLHGFSSPGIEPRATPSHLPLQHSTTILRILTPFFPERDPPTIADFCPTLCLAVSKPMISAFFRVSYTRVNSSPRLPPHPIFECQLVRSSQITGNTGLKFVFPFPFF